MESQGRICKALELVLMLSKRGLTDVAQIELLCLQLQVLSEHVEVLVAALVLLREERLWHLLSSLRVRAQ